MPGSKNYWFSIKILIKKYRFWVPSRVGRGRGSKNQRFSIKNLVKGIDFLRFSTIFIDFQRFATFFNVFQRFSTFFNVFQRFSTILGRPAVSGSVGEFRGRFLSTFGSNIDFCPDNSANCLHSPQSKTLTKGSPREQGEKNVRLSVPTFGAPNLALAWGPFFAPDPHFSHGNSANSGRKTGAQPRYNPIFKCTIQNFAEFARFARFRGIWARRGNQDRTYLSRAHPQDYGRKTTQTPSNYW